MSPAAVRIVKSPRDAPYFGSPAIPGNLALSMVVTRNGLGYLVLDGFGGVHKFGSAARRALGRQVTPYFGFDITRDITLTPDGLGYAVLDAFGGVHVGGNAVARNTGYWPGRDNARDIVIAPDNAGYAVVDVYGGVHAAGSAPRVVANWARWGWRHAGGLTMSNGGYLVAS